MTAMAQVTPTLGEFLELARQGNVIPVFAEFIADGETPVSAFKKLDRGGYSFLFESTEKNDVSGRFSFVGVEARVGLQSHGREVRIIEERNQRRLETSSDPLEEVRKLLARYQFVSRPELPRFAGGAVGFIGYEAIHFFEPKVPLAQQNELQLPEALFMRHTRFLILSGGLDAQNVGRAIAAVTPHAVDVCSGVESAPGVKDHRALEQLISAVRAASPMTNASSLKS